MNQIQINSNHTKNSEINLDKNISNSSNDKGDSEEQHLLNEINNTKILENNEIEEENGLFSNIEKYKPNRKGNMIMLFYNKDEEPLIVIGPNWPLSLFMIIIIDIISFCYFYFLWNLLFKFIIFIGIIIFLFQTCVYLLVILMNPGIPSKELWLENYLINNKDEIGTYRICNICKTIMRNKDKTDHCDECNVCIIGADHHCPWTSKCVGKKNKKLFYLFVCSTFTLLLYFFCGIFSLAFIDDKTINKKIIK